MQFVIGNYFYLLSCSQILTLNLNFCIYIHVPPCCLYVCILVTAAILDFGPYRCLKMCNRIFFLVHTQIKSNQSLSHFGLFLRDCEIHTLWSALYMVSSWRTPLLVLIVLLSLYRWTDIELLV